MPYQETKYKIDLIKNQIATHGKLDDSQLKKINYKFRLEWNYNSNSMEGNTLTVAETRSVMVGNLDVHQKPLRDVLEMKGHDEIVSEILKIGKGDLRLSESRIKKIHEAIIHESEEIRKNQIGKWKQHPNEIINNRGEKYSFVGVDEVEDKIHDLLNRTNASLDSIYGKKKNAPHPLDVAFQFHLEFLNIHPFHDGNGRVSRILTNLILIASGYPPFWINKQERDVYYNYISDIQGYGGDKVLLDDFMAGLVLRSQQLVLDVIEGKDIEEEDDLNKEIEILKRQFNDEQIVKSPKAISNIFSFITSTVFHEFQQVLAQFDSFFSEIKEKRMFNYAKELVPKNGITSLASHFSDSKHPESVKIFGYSIYENDVEFLEWETVMYGLRKAVNTINYSIILKVDFYHLGYSLSLKIDGAIVFQADFKYDDYPNVNVIKNFKKELAKEIILKIKQDTKITPASPPPQG